MKQLKVKLNSIDDVKKLNRLAEMVDGYVDASIEKYVVDAKSLLGLLSLNLMKTITISVNCVDEKYFNSFKDGLNKLEVIVG